MKLSLLLVPIVWGVGSWATLKPELGTCGRLFSQRSGVGVSTAFREDRSFLPHRIPGLYYVRRIEAHRHQGDRCEANYFYTAKRYENLPLFEGRNGVEKVTTINKFQDQTHRSSVYFHRNLDGTVEFWNEERPKWGPVPTNEFYQAGEWEIPKPVDGLSFKAKNGTLLEWKKVDEVNHPFTESVWSDLFVLVGEKAIPDDPISRTSVVTNFRTYFDRGRGPIFHAKVKSELEVTEEGTQEIETLFIDSLEGVFEVLPEEFN